MTISEQVLFFVLVLIGITCIALACISILYEHDKKYVAGYSEYDKGYLAGYSHATSHFLESLDWNSDFQCKSLTGNGRITCIGLFFSSNGKTNKYPDLNYYWIGIDKNGMELVETEDRWLFRPSEKKEEKP